MLNIHAGALSKGAIRNDPYYLGATGIYVADSRFKHQYHS